MTLSPRSLLLALAFVGLAIVSWATAADAPPAKLAFYSPPASGAVHPPAGTAGLAPLADFIMKQLPGLQSIEEFAEESVREVNRLRGFGAAGPTGYAVMTEA